MYVFRYDPADFVAQVARAGAAFARSLAGLRVSPAGRTVEVLPHFLHMQRCTSTPPTRISVSARWPFWWRITPVRQQGDLSRVGGSVPTSGMR